MPQHSSGGTRVTDTASTAPSSSTRFVDRKPGTVHALPNSAGEHGRRGAAFIYLQARTDGSPATAEPAGCDTEDSKLFGRSHGSVIPIPCAGRNRWLAASIVAFGACGEVEVVPKQIQSHRSKNFDDFLV